MVLSQERHYHPYDHAYPISTPKNILDHCLLPRYDDLVVVKPYGHGVARLQLQSTYDRFRNGDPEAVASWEDFAFPFDWHSSTAKIPLEVTLKYKRCVVTLHETEMKIDRLTQIRKALEEEYENNRRNNCSCCEECYRTGIVWLAEWILSNYFEEEFGQLIHEDELKEAALHEKMVRGE